MSIVARIFAVLPLLLACASATPSQLQDCDALAELPDLPERSCLAQSDTVTFQHRVAEAIGDDVKSTYFSVLIDSDSRAKGVCVIPSRTSDLWSERSVLSARSGDLATLPPGPACLATRRIDLNRRSMIAGEIKRMRNMCDVSTGPPTEIAVGFEQGRASLMALRSSWCSQLSDDWITLPPKGLRRQLIFAPPEVADPKIDTAVATRAHCFRYREREDRVACIQSHGWELLE
jgi:hypothetical protein